MKIVSVLPTPLMVYGLLPGFKELGYEVDSFPFYIFKSNYGPNESEKNEQTLKKLETEFMSRDFDYIILEGFQDKVMNNLRELCDKTGRKFIYWAIEDPILFDFTLEIAKKADYVFTTAIECIPKYKEHGIDAHLLTFGCNPNYHKLGKFKNQFDIDITMAASFYAWDCRKRGYSTILDAAKESEYDLKVWGSFWNVEEAKKYIEGCEYGGILNNFDLPDLCASSKIILGVQCDDTSITQTAMRPYEVLGCSGFHLTQWTKATESIFEDGKHLVMAKTKEEALEKIDFYMKNEKERIKIAKQGQEYVYKYHTYVNRIKENILPFILK